MATLDIAAKGEPAIAVPALVLLAYLDKVGKAQPITTTYQDGRTLSGDECFIRVTTAEGKALSDRAAIEELAEKFNSLTGAQNEQSVSEWVKRSDGLASKEFQTIRKALDELNVHLMLRSYIIGYDLTAADLVVWSTLRANNIALAAVRKAQNNVLRWYTHIEACVPWASETANEFLSIAAKDRHAARAAASAAGASYDIDLPGMTGPMVTRFPPEPSGYLHIGHVKAAILNDYFAHKEKGGTLICRFDDTNPSKESMEFQDSILEDLKLLEIVADRVSHSSDYFQLMYEYAVQLIKDGKAFADDSQLGKGDEDRKNRLPSKRRDLGIEETLQRFEEMKTGSEEGQRWCLRARIQYDSPNGSLRDPVVYRCNLTPHHRTGTQWKIYPTYDFCAPILDSFEGVTVALRTNEYRDRNAQYEWMQQALGLRSVPIWDFSRINFIRTLLSKRKLTKLVDEGQVGGWDDPRMPTVRGILRRGMEVSALREFFIKQGPSRNVLNLEWGAIWALNKKYVDPIAARYTAIAEDQAVRCRVLGSEGRKVIQKPKYVKNPDLGSKNVLCDETVILEQADAQLFKEGEEITLMNWGNAYVRTITRDGDGKIVTGIDLELHLAGDVKKTKKVTWLATTDEKNTIPVELVQYDYLITKDKLEKEDDVEKFMNPVTEVRSAALADWNVAELSAGAIVQFERKGYYKYDGMKGSKMVFVDIPSGKS